MRIKHIAYHGVKGQSGRHDLAPVQIFFGPNGAGKSAIGEALRLLLVGWTAKTGKTAAGVYERRGTASKVHVEGRDTEERTHWRTWEKVGRSVGCQSSQGIPETPPVMLDFGTFLSMTTRARTAYLFSLIDPADMQMDAPALTAAVKGIRLDPHPPEAETAITTLVKIIEGVVHERPERQDFLRLVIEQMRSALSEETANHKRLQQTADGLLASDGQQERTVRANIDTLVRESAEKMEELLGDISRAERALADWRAANQRHYNLMKKAADVPDKTAALSEARAELTAAQSALDVEKVTLAGVIADQPGEIEAKALAEATATVRRMTSELGFAESEAKRVRRAMEAKGKEMTGLDKLIACPFCKCAGDGWKATLLAGLMAEHAELANQCTTLDTACATIRSQLDDHCADEAEMLRRAAVMKETEKNIRGRVETASRRLQRAHSNVSEIEVQKARGEQALEEADDSTPPAGAEEDFAREHELAVGALATHKTAHALLVEEQREAIGRRAKAAQRAEAVEQAAAAKTAMVVLKQAVGLMEERQDDILKRTVGGFIFRAQALTGSILHSPLEFKDGEIGRLQDGVWIGLADFSRGEEMLAYGALSAALAFEAPFRCVIFDDLGVIDPANKVTLIQRMSALVQEGWCDQFVAFDVSRAGIIGDCAVKEI